MSDRTAVIPLRRSPVNLARDGFLDRFANKRTRASYANGIDQWLDYCARRGLDPLTIGRAHLEKYSRHLEDVRGLKPSSVAQHQIALAGFYHFAFVDGVIDRDPMAHVKRRKVPDKSMTNGLDKFELADMIAAAEQDPDPRAHALICLLGLNGMRISGALGIDIRHVDLSPYKQPTITIILKGEDELTVPLGRRATDAVRQLIGDRESGPLFVTSSGARWRRNHAHAVVARIGRAAKIRKHVHPHSLRHAFVTNALDQGVPMRDVMGSTGHKDPRSMLRYDRSRGAIERNATWSVSALVEGLIRPA